MSCGNCSFTLAKTHYLQYQPLPWRQRALAARNPRNSHPKSAVISRVRGTVGYAKIMKLAKSRRRVPVVKLPAQHLKGKINRRRTRISSFDCSRDLAKNVINDGF